MQYYESKDKIKKLKNELIMKAYKNHEILNDSFYCKLAKSNVYFYIKKIIFVPICCRSLN